MQESPKNQAQRVTWGQQMSRTGRGRGHFHVCLCSECWAHTQTDAVCQKYESSFACLRGTSADSVCELLN